MSENKNRGVLSIAEPAIVGTSTTLESLGRSQAFLFDLDDTIAIYDEQFIVSGLFETLKDHTYKVPDEEAKVVATDLHRHMNFGDRQKKVLSSYFDGQEIRTFWDSFTARFHADIRHEHVTFDSRLVKFINFAIRNELEVGVISNSSPDAENRVLDYLRDINGIDLTSRALFLGSSSIRKPSPNGLSVFAEQTGSKIVPSSTAYIGNSMSDLLFAKNTKMTPVLIDYLSTVNAAELTEMQKELIADSVVITNFASLKNFIERSKPNYRRQISLSVEPSLSKGPDVDLRQMPLCLEPTEDNLYRTVTEGASTVMEHVPSIFRRFHDDFENSETFSIVSLANYNTLFHEATGAIRLPDPDSLAEPYKSYFSANRVRTEGEHTFARGPSYYRQYVPELADNQKKQIHVVRKEINDAIKLLTGLADESTAESHVLKLAVQDNLRGNVQSLYLSVVNALRQDDTPDNIHHLKSLYDSVGTIYRETIQLEYSHMLGLPYNEDEDLKSIRTINDSIDSYEGFSEEHDYPLKFKSPEVDHPILIAARANEICNQYPNLDLLVGLSSGGVELSTVTQMLAKHKLTKDVDLMHYPISVHHGLSMWSKDKEVAGNQSLIDDFFNVDAAEGKNVIICEDNSNSGQTLDRVTSRFNAAGAAEVHFAVIEIDPTRVIMHAVQQKAGAKHGIGQAANRTRPVVNYFHPDFVGAVSVVKILLSDQGFSKIIAIDTANKYEQG